MVVTVDVANSEPFPASPEITSDIESKSDLDSTNPVGRLLGLASAKARSMRSNMPIKGSGGASLPKLHLF